MSRTIAWFSCGAASAVAAKLSLNKFKNVVVAYCDTMEDEHPDNQRFFNEIQEWLGVGILRLKSDKYENVDDVIAKKKYLAGIHGAPCTNELKKKVREAFQEPDDVNVFGYTIEERHRVKRILKNMPELNFSFPLLNESLSKQDCIALLARQGIEIPEMYKLGYANNNCLGCVKAANFTYWKKIKVDFPDVFEKRAKQERKYNAAINKQYINGVRTRVFLDEFDSLPDDIGINEVAPDFSCGIMCSLVESDL